MMTVHRVSKLTGVSIRALRYYDSIGLLKATAYTDAGYRLYDDAALERLQQIMLFRELEFPLRDIKQILSSPDFDRHKAIQQQIELLTLKKAHIENLIALARGIQQNGDRYMDFSAFDKAKTDEYARQAKAQWGETGAYAQYRQKQQTRSATAEAVLGQGLMQIFTELGALRNEDPGCADAQHLVKKLQSYITEHFYRCSDQILAGLGQMYASGSEFTQNIDASSGSGTAEFANAAIQIFCGKSA